MKRTLACLALGVALASVTVPAGAWHSDLPAIERVTSPGEGAWSVTIRMNEPGSFAIELEGNTSEDATRAALGAAELTPDGTAMGMANLILLSSSDRVVVAKELDRGPADGLSFDHTGDSNLEGEFWGVAARQSGATGTYRYGFWMGGMDQVSLTVRADADADVELREGTPHMMGSADFTDGEANVQAQGSGPEPENTETPTPGVKVIRDASVEVPVEHQLVGTWLGLEPDTACQAVVQGTCVPAHAIAGYAARTGEELCYQRTGLDCAGPRDTADEETETRISWQGPAGAGEGSLWYRFEGSPAGSYEFTIDQVTDAYTGPLVYDAQTGTFASLQPVHLLLVLADLPNPPTLE